MPTTLQFRRYDSANIANTTGAVGEIFIDTDKDTIVVQDGSTSGGFVLARESVVNAAYDQANSAYDEANLKLNITGGTITGSLIVSGNLEVLGNSTTLNVETLLVEDNEIVLNANVTSAPNISAFITVNRGSETNVALRWNEATNNWEWTNDGIVYYEMNTALVAYDAANAASVLANNALNLANSAFDQANGAYAQANVGINIAENAYSQANTAFHRANLAYDQANSAYNQANAGTTVAQSAYGQANAAYNQANSAYAQANSAYDAANNAKVTVYANNQSNITTQIINFVNTSTIIVSVTPDGTNANVSFETTTLVSNDAYNQANSAYDQANAAYAQANAAYDDANTRVLKAGDTMTGNLNVAATLITQNVEPDVNITYDLGTSTKRFKDLWLSNSTIHLGEAGINAIGQVVVVPSLNTTTLNVNTLFSGGINVSAQASAAYEQANDAYEQANTGTSVAQNAFAQANTAYGQANDAYTQANTGTTVAQNAYAQANAAYTQANTATTNAGNAYDQANSAYTQANTGTTVAQNAYGQANLAYTQANTGTTVAQNAYAQANAAYAEANLKLNLTGGIIVGDVSITGNLLLNGNATTISTQDLVVDDPIFLIGNNNTTNAVALGFVGHYGPTQQHTGFIRAHQDEIWYLFEGYDDHILYANNVLDTANIKLATLRANVDAGNLLLSGNLVATQANLTLAHDQANSAYDQANTATTVAQNAYNQANTARNVANSAYNQANTATTNAGNAYNQANTATTNAGNAYNQANTATTVAQNAYGQANSAFNAANTKLEAYDGTLRRYKENVVSATLSTNSYALDLSLTNIFNLTLSNANTTLTLSNTPPSGFGYTMTIVAKQDANGNRGLTFPAAFKFPNATRPSLSTAANAVDILNFFTVDGGNTFYGALSLANTA